MTQTLHSPEFQNAFLAVLVFGFVIAVTIGLV